MTDRVIAPHQFGDDAESNIRPQSLQDFTGQEALKDSLSIAIQAACMRQEALDHCLFAGPPGLGKTTLAGIIAKEMNSKLHLTSGPVLDKPAMLAGLLTTELQEGDILFIDEIHRLPRLVEEYLYPAMEDFRLDLKMDTGGPSARSLNIPLKRFTLVGATTRSGLLTSPLRDRFGLQFRLSLYTPTELVKILKRSAHILEVQLDPDAAILLGERCRGTPRIANRVLRRCRDVAQVKGNSHITPQIAERTLSMLAIDTIGLDEMDRAILHCIMQKFSGGPVGLSTLAAALGEEAETIEEVYEPYLIQQGMLARTPRGRVATPNAYQHLGLSIPPGLADFGWQESLF
jgi:holliday junction DNA helicase RuvB